MEPFGFQHIISFYMFVFIKKKFRNSTEVSSRKLQKKSRLHASSRSCYGGQTFFLKVKEKETENENESHSFCLQSSLV